MLRRTTPPFLLIVALMGALLLPGALSGQVGSPAGPVSPDILQARRQRLLEALDGSPAILSSARPRDMENDYFQDSDYREDNDFFYLTGLEAPGSWLVLNGAEEGEVVLYLPPRSPASERWTGPQLGPGEEAQTLTGL
ncbi:aminopeptidase P N-terminal domain-containing protein, partial [Gemmatimonadota bacterium]